MLASSCCRLMLLARPLAFPSAATAVLTQPLSLLAAQQPLLLASSRCLSSSPSSSSASSSPTVQFGEASVVYQDGLPRFRLPLPSRSPAACQFTLKPLTNSVEDLARYIKAEDRSVETVAFYAKGGVRITGSNPVEALLRCGDFEVQLNDRRFAVSVPGHHEAAEVAAVQPASDGDEGPQQLEDVKNSIAKLYTGLNVRDYQLARERLLLNKLEALRLEIQPLEDVRLQLADKASKRTRMLTWLGLSYMGLQFGLLARLTWWEYSWDIMEPVIYFVGYGTVMVAYAYYVITKQEYTFPKVWNREYLKKFYADAQRANFDVAKYSDLREKITDLETDLRRLRDPLLLGPSQLLQQPQQQRS